MQDYAGKRFACFSQNTANLCLAKVKMACGGSSMAKKFESISYVYSHSFSLGLTAYVGHFDLSRTALFSF